jgi:transposase
MQSYEELAAHNQELKARNQELEARCQRLEELLKKALERISVLEERLNKDSKNSSKPPSTDQKSNTSSNARKEKPLRRGFHRALIPLDQVDHHHVCQLECCPCCGSRNLTEERDPIILQQIELPEVKGVVSQFDRHTYFCSDCFKNAIAPLPLGIPNSAFGPRLMALMATLTGVFHLSKDEARSLVQGLYQIEISDGSQINIEERVTLALAPVNERIHSFVSTSIFCKHFDETSWRDQGKTHYVWIAATKQAACYRIDRHRDKVAFMKIAGCLNEKAPVVTDRYACYNGLKNPHQFCIPHLIRNFMRFAQRDGPDGVLGLKIQKELQYLSHTHSQYRRGEISKLAWGQRLRWCRRRLDDLFLDGFLDVSKEMGNLCEKLLLDDFEKLWSFRHHKDAEPSNNLAERGLRRIVLWRKKSNGTRSDRGQRFVEVITGVTETLRRTGQNIMDFITHAVVRFYSGLEAPYIQPQHGF